MANSVASLPSGECAVSAKDVAAVFGISEGQLPDEVGPFSFNDLRYRVLNGAERDAVVLDVLKKTDSESLRIAGANDNTVWEDGWGEILARLQGSTEPLETLLKPQYFQHHRILRFRGQFIDAFNTEFVYNYDRILRTVAIKRFLSDANRIVELGSGTGTTQLLLAALVPSAELVSSDWARSSQQIVQLISQRCDRDIATAQVNMLDLYGWKALRVDRHCAVLTIHAMEQLGDNWRPLLNALLAQKPKLCVHLEPVLEMYNQEELFDYIAAKYHKRRNYLLGYLTALQRLASEGLVKIQEQRRLQFGDRYHEAYTLIVWSPT